MRPDLCATDCDIPPREFLGKIWTDSLVHDDAALRLLVEVFFLRITIFFLLWTDSLVHDDAALRLLVEVFFPMGLNCS